MIFLFTTMEHQVILDFSIWFLHRLFISPAGHIHNYLKFKTKSITVLFERCLPQGIIISFALTIFTQLPRRYFKSFKITLVILWQNNRTAHMNQYFQRYIAENRFYIFRVNGWR